MPRSRANPKRLEAFVAHGATIRGESGDELVCDCPFSGKQGKLYINRRTLLWHSKVESVGGAFSDFLRLIAQMYEKNLQGDSLGRLARARGLPREAFAGWGVGFDGRHYTIPVRDEDDMVVDIRRWRPGGRVLATKGCSTGMLGHENIARSPEDWPVYVCEGEWDAIALNWLIRKKLGRYKINGVVVGVPGANTFKVNWAEAFRDRRVYACYDNDGPGQQGELQLQKRLEGVASSILYLHWPEGLEDGYDIRDYVISGAIDKRKPLACWRGLKRYFYKQPREGVKSDIEPDEEIESEESAYTDENPADLEQLRTVFKRWMKLKDTDVIEVILATVISQELSGDPVWMFVVGPAGSAKTETLVTLNADPEIYEVSTLSTHALISGFPNTKKDPSLIPSLNDKTLVVKDFTPILQMKEGDKAEIFGLLRDAYDGHCGKVFGNGIRRHYKSRFTVVAGVTPAIYEMSAEHAGLGERFLKYLTAENIRRESEDDVLRRVILNVGREDGMRHELRDVVQSFLARKRREIERDGVPTPPMETVEFISGLAKISARMRGTVPRDKYRHEVVIGRPTVESPARLAKQFQKLMVCLMIVTGEGADERVSWILRKCVLDTMSQRREDILRTLWERTGKDADDSVGTRAISEHVHYPITTVQREMDDLVMLEVAVRVSTGLRRYEFSLSPYMRELIVSTDLYGGLRGPKVDRPHRREIRRLRKPRSKERTQRRPRRRLRRRSSQP